jgi:uncharacterized membrane protein
MSTPDPRWTDERVEQSVSTLLRTGVTVAGAIALIGGLIYLITNGLRVVDYTTFLGPSSEFHTVRGIIAGALKFESRALIQLGLLLLIATPIARVALSLVGFIKQRDRTYIIITTIVLLILLFGLSGKQ